MVTHSQLRTGRQKMFDELGWLSVKQLILYHTLLAFNRIRKSQEPEYLANILSRDNHYGTIIIPNINLSLYRKSFGFRGASNWNSLPERLRNLEQLGTFKKDLEFVIVTKPSSSNVNVIKA